MSLPEFVVQVIAGVSRGSIYFVVAAGLTMTLGSMNVLNIAHGSFYMVAAYLATTIIGEFGPNGGFVVAIVVVPVAIMALGGVIERGVMRRTYDYGHFTQLLATFALVLIIDDLTRTTFGPEARTVARPEVVSRSVDVMGLPVQTYNFLMIGLAVVIAVGLIALMRHTNFGREVRACVDDPDVVGVVGVNLVRVRQTVFVLGAGLAGLAGAVAAPAAAVQPGMDVAIIITALSVTIIGGLGSIGGAALAALIVGLVESLGVFVVQRGSLAIIFVLTALILTVRPTGIFGSQRAH